MIYWDRAKHDTCVSLHSPAAPTTAAPVRVFGKSSSAKFLQNFMKVWREQSWRELGKKNSTSAHDSKYLKEERKELYDLWWY